MKGSQSKEIPNNFVGKKARLFAYVDKNRPHLLKNFLEQYFAMREYGDNFPMVDSSLVMRNSFVRKLIRDFP